MSLYRHGSICGNQMINSVIYRPHFIFVEFFINFRNSQKLNTKKGGIFFSVSESTIRRNWFPNIKEIIVANFFSEPHIVFHEVLRIKVCYEFQGYRIFLGIKTFILIFNFKTGTRTIQRNQHGKLFVCHVTPY